MYKYLFSGKQTSLLQFHWSEKDWKKGYRIKAVHWIDEDWSCCQIARTLFIDEESARRYIRDYQQSQKLKNASGGSVSKLN